LNNSAVDLITKIGAGLKKTRRRGFQTSRHTRSLLGESASDCPYKRSMQSACHWMAASGGRARGPNAAVAQESGIGNRPIRGRPRRWVAKPGGVPEFRDPGKAHHCHGHNQAQPDKQEKRRD
jgi:hypothetical protein